MYWNVSDSRRPLEPGERVCLVNGGDYIIDAYAGSGGFALTYIAHEAETERYAALKELFPRRLEDAAVQREADGRIVIFNPITGARSDAGDAWQPLLDYFRREADLTRRAAALVDAEGDRVRQNNPDALNVRGPFAAANGNYYLVLDTYWGISLREYINGGWEAEADRGRFVNSRIREVVDLLSKTALRLARLHRDNHMLHLDISPSNIYVTERNAGADLEPYLIDYGSAYDLDDPSDLADHRFTCNPFSPPEIRALADLNDQDSGYRADPSSDTYSLCGILLYALTGVDPAAFQAMGRWKSLLRALFPPEVYQGPAGDSDGLAEQIIRMLEQGLAASQSRRFRTANELYQALQALRKGLGQTGILSHMESGALLASLALERYPLYDYARKNESLRILCMGTGPLVDQFILSAISCGQMLDRGLQIHVAAPEAEAYGAALLARCPALRLYSNLSPAPDPACEYVTFSFTNLRELNRDTVPELLQSEGRLSRYVVISQGSDGGNRALAEAAAAELARRAEGVRCVVHYYTKEEAARSIPGRPCAGGADVELVPMGVMTPAYRKAADSLGLRAFNMHCLYTKLSNPTVNRSALLREFVNGPDAAYVQPSSAAAALHIKYKLRSLGIDLKKGRAHVAQQYLRKLPACRGRLMALEHRRWLMYMAADGYDFPGTREKSGAFLPDLAQIDGYGFRESRDGFVRSFHSAAQKLHPCMVPYGAEDAFLSRDKTFWDSFQRFEAINASGLDPLDRVSLSLHLLAARRITSPAFLRRIESIVQDRMGDRLRPLLEENEALASAFRRFSRWCGGLPQRRALKDYQLEETLLLQALQQAGCPADIRQELAALRDELAIVDEFARYKDYKAADAAIVDHLAWVFCVPRDMTLVKLKAGETVSTIAAPLIMEPRRLVCCGCADDGRLAAFFRRHGDNTAVSFALPDGEGYAQLAEDLRLLCGRLPSPVVIDMTGADGLACAAAIQAAQRDRSIGVVRYNAGRGALEEICNFPLAAVYTLPVTLLVEEAYLLYGASEVASGGSYLLELKESMPALWAFYRKYRDRWDMVTDFFQKYGRPRAELYRPEFSVDQDTRWSGYIGEAADSLLERTGLDRCLRDLEQAGILRELSLMPARGVTEVRFQCPAELWHPLSALLARLPNLPFSWEIQPLEGGKFQLRISSETRVSLSDAPEFENREAGKKYAMEKMKKALEDLAGSRLIHRLSLGQPGRADSRLSFVYASNAVRDVLAKGGNILEAYVWEQAVASGFFDDIRPNFMFRWQEEQVSNELDVIATKGLSTLVISCKTAKFSKEHLYEVKYLADRFSIHSKAVLVYSSPDKTAADGRRSGTAHPLRSRAAAMGIYLIDRRVLDAGTLGTTLVKIADGALSPGDLLP